MAKEKGTEDLRRLLSEELGKSSPSEERIGDLRQEFKQSQEEMETHFDFLKEHAGKNKLLNIAQGIDALQQRKINKANLNFGKVVSEGNTASTERDKKRQQSNKRIETAIADIGAKVTDMHNNMGGVVSGGGQKISTGNENDVEVKRTGAKPSAGKRKQNTPSKLAMLAVNMQAEKEGKVFNGASNRWHENYEEGEKAGKFVKAPVGVIGDVIRDKGGFKDNQYRQGSGASMAMQTIGDGLGKQGSMEALSKAFESGSEGEDLSKSFKAIVEGLQKQTNSKSRDPKEAKALTEQIAKYQVDAKAMGVGDAIDLDAVMKQQSGGSKFKELMGMDQQGGLASAFSPDHLFGNKDSGGLINNVRGMFGGKAKAAVESAKEHADRESQGKILLTARDDIRPATVKSTDFMDGEGFGEGDYPIVEGKMHDRTKAIHDRQVSEDPRTARRAGRGSIDLNPQGSPLTMGLNENLVNEKIGTATAEPVAAGTIAAQPAMVSRPGKVDKRTGIDKEPLAEKQLNVLEEIRDILRDGGGAGGGSESGGGMFDGLNPFKKKGSKGPKKAGRFGKFLKSPKAKLAGKALGAVAAVGMGVYTAVSGVNNAEDMADAGELNAEEEQKAKSEAIGEGTGGATGALAGAAAGAAIGSVVPFVGTAIGGIIGGALGWWGGSKAGKAAGGAIADAIPVSAEDLAESNAQTENVLSQIEERDSGLAGQIRQEAAGIESTLLAEAGDSVSDKDKASIKNAAMVQALLNNPDATAGIDRNVSAIDTTLESIAGGDTGTATTTATAIPVMKTDEDIMRELSDKSQTGLSMAGLRTVDDMRRFIDARDTDVATGSAQVGVNVRGEDELIPMDAIQIEKGMFASTIGRREGDAAIRKLSDGSYNSTNAAGTEIAVKGSYGKGKMTMEEIQAGIQDGSIDPDNGKAAIDQLGKLSNIENLGAPTAAAIDNTTNAFQDAMMANADMPPVIVAPTTNVASGGDSGPTVAVAAASGARINRSSLSRWQDSAYA